VLVRPTGLARRYGVSKQQYLTPLAIEHQEEHLTNEPSASEGESGENALHALEEITSEFQVDPFSTSGLTSRVGFMKAIGLLSEHLNEGVE
jgi:hypothetical protein